MTHYFARIFVLFFFIPVFIGRRGASGGSKHVGPPSAAGRHHFTVRKHSAQVFGTPSFSRCCMSSLAEEVVAPAREM
jgi:hypothetical protein